MLIAALVVGLLTAYYFGVRLGLVAAGATAALFLVAAIAPALALWAYVAVGVGVGGLMFMGPRLRRQGTPSQYAWFTKRSLLQVRRMLARLRAQAGLGERRDQSRRERGAKGRRDGDRR